MLRSAVRQVCLLAYGWAPSNETDRNWNRGMMKSNTIRLAVTSILWACLLILSVATAEAQSPPPESQEDDVAGQEADPPEIAIYGLSQTIELEGNDEFSVEASLLSIVESYSIEVTVSNANARFDTGCSDYNESWTVSANDVPNLVDRTSSRSFKLYGCGLGRSTVTATLTESGNTTYSVSRTVRIITKPNQVLTPTVDPGNGRLGVSWSAPSNGGSVITGYKVRHKRTTVLLWGSAVDVDSTSKTITRLTNGYSYHVQVRACNVAGCGLWSAPPVVGTPRTVPVRVSTPTVDPGNGRLGVSWSAPSNGGSVITGYNVQYQRTTASASSWISVVDVDSTSETITGLTNGLSYNVQVQACNVAGCGLWSNPPVVGTPRTVPGRVSMPTVDPGNGQLGVGWSTPSNGGSVITGYNVQYQRTTASSSSWISVVDVDSTSETITGLTNGLSYNVQVQACNVAGCGLWSNPPVVGTPRTVPNQVSTPTVDPGNGQLGVSWSVPSNGGSVITGYNVQYQRTTASSSSWISAGGATAQSRSMTIFGLTNGLSYNVQVQACNAVGCGDWSSSVVGTPRTVPGRVSTPTVNEGDRQLGVSWSAPSNGGSVITGYDVRYQPTASSWTSAWTVTSTSETITGLTNGLSYRVQVRACNAAGCGLWSYSGVGTPRTVPGQVLTLTVNGGGSELSVSWSAPSTTGGSAVTRYEVQYKRKSASWPSGPGSDNGTSLSRKIDGLTNGYAYLVRVRACNAAGCGSWSPESSEVFLLAKPTGLDVSPLGSRKARLTWTASAGANANTVYDVYAKTQNGSWPTSPIAANLTSASDGHVIDLDNIVGGKGLAHETSFQLRVVARDKTYATASAQSSTIRIKDNPLLLSGGSAKSNSAGAAELEWESITGAANYVIEYRELGPRPKESRQRGPWPRDDQLHSSIEWPEHPDWPYYGTHTELPSFQQAGTGRINRTVTGLEDGEIYAFQVNYEISGEKVFSARDAYVWSSTDFPANAARVGTYTFFGHHQNREFEYTICESTFPDDPATAMVNERAQWVSLLENAFGQWEVATDGFITMTRDTSRSCASDYSTNMAQFIIDDDRQNEVRMLDVTLDVNTSSVDNKDDRSNVWSFPEVKSDVFKSCLLPRAKRDQSGNKTGDVIYTPACVSSFIGYSGLTRLGPQRRARITELVQKKLEGTISLREMGELFGIIVVAAQDPRRAQNVLQGVDVTFSQRAFFEMNGNNVASTKNSPEKPTSGIKFNTCLPDKDPSSSDPDRKYFAYTTAVHEAGHVLGLSNFSYADIVLIGDQPYEAAHPTIPDAVLNYDQQGKIRYPIASGFSEPDCSPHPFDLMAIYALYQTVLQVSISGPAQGRKQTSVTLTANVSRGTRPYTYEWSTPEWSLAFTPNNRASSVSIMLPDISGADPIEQRTVTVIVTVTDANGTVVTDRHEVIVNP